MRFLSFQMLLCIVLAAGAQPRHWYNPMNDSLPFIEGRAWNAETGTQYHRLPPRAKDSVRTPLWNLACETAGLYVRFYSDATDIQVRYKATGGYSMPHMPATGVSGVDLYSLDCNGNRTWCMPRYAFADTVRYAFSGLTYRNTHRLGNEYCLYLPLYNGVKHLEIGVPEGASFRFITPSAERPIVVYGTSIAQGACASRPGMAWTNIVQRMLDCPVVNLGFSGNGQLELPLFNLMAEVDARMFVIDCMPNMTDGRVKLIRERVIQGVERLRRASAAPILLVEHDGYMGGAASDAEKRRYEDTNKELRAAYELLKPRVPNLHYMTFEEIAMGMDCQVDGVHATDLGMQRYADSYVRKIRSILPHAADSLRAYEPCRQRREPGTYEWNERHETVLAWVRNRRPDVVLLGNSITHYWGGEPFEKRRAGQKAWDKLFRGRNVANLGCGWDYIENVLWRIEHGELDGYEARKVCLLIGTNNLWKDDNARIVKGIRQLVAEIRARQPKAAVCVCAILPRSGQEPRIAELNAALRPWVEADESLCWLDAAPVLTDKAGKVVPELFSDGLHPNEKGYARIASLLKRFIERP